MMSPLGSIPVVCIGTIWGVLSVTFAMIKDALYVAGQAPQQLQNQGSLLPLPVVTLQHLIGNAPTAKIIWYKTIHATKSIHVITYFMFFILTTY